MLVIGITNLKHLLAAVTMTFLLKMVLSVTCEMVNISIFHSGSVSQNKTDIWMAPFHMFLYRKGRIQRNIKKNRIKINNRKLKQFNSSSK